MCTFIDDDVLKSYSLLAGERSTDLPSTWKQAFFWSFFTIFSEQHDRGCCVGVLSS